MRENIRRSILVIASILALIAIVFIFVALWRQLGWAIPTLALVLILAFIGWRIWRFAGVKRFVNFIATILALAIIGFMGWAIWNHFSNQNGKDLSDGAMSSEQIDSKKDLKDEQGDKNTEKSSESKDKENKDELIDKKEDSVDNRADQKSTDVNNKSVEVSDSQNKQSTQSGTSSNDKLPEELPKTGFELQD